MKMSVVKICNILVAVAMLLPCCSCSCKRVASNRQNIKSTFASNMLKDSIFLHDSIFVKETADTVFLTRYRVMYRDRVKTDTLWRCDTVTAVREVLVERKSNALPILKFMLPLMLFFFLWKSGFVSSVKKMLPTIFK
ncbi:MAG: hypothetical protein IJA04_08730 [Bacteroidaceae bacterium]|nr:hypothetical protein [Bacteroidales bacterium]MBQ3623767.1 hypothetical protein [Bacteroidaceae bacterium]